MLAADLHLGYSVGKTQMRQMVEKINRESPDLVVIAGDVFDNDYEAMDDPEALISILQVTQIKYGVYAVTAITTYRKKFWRALPLTVRVRKRRVIRGWTPSWNVRASAC